jgi:hypothetical protein
MTSLGRMRAVTVLGAVVAIVSGIALAAPAASA